MEDLSRVIAKGSRTVLRGERRSNVSDLLDDIDEDPELYGEEGKTGDYPVETQVSANEVKTGAVSDPSHTLPSKTERSTDPLSQDEIFSYIAMKSLNHDHGDDGTIYVFPDFSDIETRTWLKEHGFKWDSKGKRWYL